MSNRRIYRKIAKEYGVTVEEVKRDMQAAIDHAYKNTPADGVTGAYQNRVPRSGEIPTTDEFIRYAADAVRKKKHGLY